MGQDMFCIYRLSVRLLFFFGLKIEVRSMINVLMKWRGVEGRANYTLNFEYEPLVEGDLLLSLSSHLS